MYLWYKKYIPIISKHSLLEAQIGTHPTFPPQYSQNAHSILLIYEIIFYE